MEHFCVVGLSHESSPVHIRERFSVETRNLERSLALLSRFHGMQGVLLSTCNRCELYFFDADGQQEAHQFFQELSGLSEKELTEHLFQKSGNKAVDHLFAVATGLRSQVLGEKEILGQVKRAYEASLHIGKRSAELSALFEQAISLGKLARTKTKIHYGSVSLASLAIDQAMRSISRTELSRVAVLGAGQMGEQLLRELRQRFPRAELFSISHILEAAEQAAEPVQGVAKNFSALPEVVSQIDAVFCASASPHRILDAPLLCEALQMRESQMSPLVLVDLGMPRNVAPDMRELPQVCLFDLDDLKMVVDRNIQQRQAAVPEVLQLCEQAKEALLKRLHRLRNAPLAKALCEQADLIRTEQLEQFFGRWADVSLDERARLEEFARKLTKQLLHGPLSEMRRLSEAEDVKLFFERVLGTALENRR